MTRCNRLLNRTILFLIAVLPVCCCIVSCDSMFFEYEGDCSTEYRVEFIYDKNMKWADAFGSEVGSVNLYAFDSNDVLAWQKNERYDGEASDAHSISLDLLPGDYKFVAYGGLSGESSDTFVLPQTKVGETRLEDLNCSLVRQKDEARNSVSRSNLTPLFHAMANVSLTENEDGGDFVFTMGMTKNTNHVRVILQQLSGEDVDVDEFSFRIEEDNGLMGYDNSLIEDEIIRYLPYHTDSGTASMTNDDYPVMGQGSAAKQAYEYQTITSVNVAIADFSIGRLVDGRKAYLTIENIENGQVAARIPLVEYALLLKQGYGREISNQDYLDRQDEYALTFFLDGRNKWIGTSIIINAWKFIVNDVDFS